MQIPLLKPSQLFCDNMNALHMTINPCFHGRTKHVELDYHFMREKVALGSLITRYVPSLNQIQDIFTKSLSKVAFCSLKNKLGVQFE